MQSIVHRLTTACRGQLSCLVSVTTVPRYLKRIGGARKESMRLVPGSQLSSPSRPSRHSLGQQGTSKQSELKMALQGVLRGRVTAGLMDGLRKREHSWRTYFLDPRQVRERREAATFATRQGCRQHRAAQHRAHFNQPRAGPLRAAPRSMTDSDQHTWSTWSA